MLPEHRNTPLSDINLSPAQILFHGQLHDQLPAKPSHYHLHRDWIISAKEREEQFTSKANQSIKEYYDIGSHELTPSEVVTEVLIQNCINNCISLID